METTICPVCDGSGYILDGDEAVPCDDPDCAYWVAEARAVIREDTLIREGARLIADMPDDLMAQAVWVRAQDWSAADRHAVAAYVASLPKLTAAEQRQQRRANGRLG